MASVFGMGSTALRNMISQPLAGRKRLSGEPSRALPKSLDAIVEFDMIPRLMVAHTRDVEIPEKLSVAVVDREFASRFATRMPDIEADQALREVEALIAGGASVRTIFLDLLAPAARELGRMWEEDECDFVDVTMGLWRLQEVMREIASRTRTVRRSLGSPARALFSPIPGDQHGFGALMIDEVFARAGWEREALIDPQRRDLLSAISRKSFDLVGLTITNDSPSSALQSLIRAIRTVSANPETRILIGGRLVNANPDLVEQIGADGTATDAFSALELAERMVKGSELHLNPAP